MLGPQYLLKLDGTGAKNMDVDIKRKPLANRCSSLEILTCEIRTCKNKNDNFGTIQRSSL